jgi:hypothetical protein
VRLGEFRVAAGARACARVCLGGEQQRRAYHRKRPLYWNCRPL